MVEMPEVGRAEEAFFTAVGLFFYNNFAFWLVMSQIICIFAL